MRETVFVGIDVGADEIHVCLMSANGAMIEEVNLVNCADTLDLHIKSIVLDQPIEIAMETGSASIRLARSLKEKGFSVTVLHSVHVAKFLKVRQNKTDRNDARGIADLIRMGAHGISQAHLKSATSQSIKSELVVRHNLVTQRVAMDNVLRSVLRMCGSPYRRWRSPDRMDQNVRAEIARLKSMGAHVPSNLEPLLDLCLAMRRYLDAETHRLENLARSIEVCARWMDIPGVGPLTALSLYSAIDEPSRFTRIADVAPYLGLVPTILQSGGDTRRRGISKRGDRLTRTYLISAAMITMRSKDTDLKRWAISLQERIGRARTRTALARKLAITMLAMWKNGGSYRPLKEQDTIHSV